MGAVGASTASRAGCCATQLLDTFWASPSGRSAPVPADAAAPAAPAGRRGLQRAPARAPPASRLPATGMKQGSAPQADCKAVSLAATQPRHVMQVGPEEAIKHDAHRATATRLRRQRCHLHAYHDSCRDSRMQLLTAPPHVGNMVESNSRRHPDSNWGSWSCNIPLLGLSML